MQKLRREVAALRLREHELSTQLADAQAKVVAAWRAVEKLPFCPRAQISRGTDDIAEVLISAAQAANDADGGKDHRATALVDVVSRLRDEIRYAAEKSLSWCAQ